MILHLFFVFLFVIVVSVLLIFIFSTLLPSMKAEGIEIKSPVFSQEEKDYEEKTFAEATPNISLVAKIEDGAGVLEEDLKNRMNFSGLKNCALFYDNYKTQYETLEKKCIGFGDCIKVCPQKGISIKNNMAFINNMCAGCGNCIEVCPVKIISFVERSSEKEAKQTEKTTGKKIEKIKADTAENDKILFKFLEKWYKIFNRVGK